MLSIRIFLVAAIVPIAALLAQPALAETLAQAVARAMATNPELRASLANRRANQEAVAGARGGYFPSIDATVGRGQETSNNISTRPLGDVTLMRSETGVTLSQLVFDTGATSSQVRRSQARSEGSGHQLASASETIGLRTALSFLEVLRLRELANIATESVEAHRRTLNLVTLLAEGGAGRRSDMQQAVARLAQALSSLYALQGQIEQAAADFRRLTDRMPGELDRPRSVAERLPAALDRAIEQALAEHPSVLAAQKDLESAQADREFSRSRLGPRLNLEMGVTQDHDVNGIRGLNYERSAMLRLRYNLFRGGSDAARIRESEARIDEATSTLAKAQTDVERDVRQAWENLNADRLRLPQLLLYADTSAEVVEAYRAQFKLGQRSLLDVLNSESESFAARSGRASGEYAVLAGEYRVLASMGRLLDTLGVTPPQGAPAETPQPVTIGER